MSHQYKNMKYEAGEKPAFLQRMIAGEKSKERPTVIGKTERDEDAPELEDEAPLIIGLDGEEHKEESEAGSSTAKDQSAQETQDKAAAKDRQAPGAGLSFGSGGASTKRKQADEGSEVVRRDASVKDSNDKPAKKKKKTKKPNASKLSFQ